MPQSVANYNVAPTQSVHAVVDDDEDRWLDLFHWGLVPFWAKGPEIGSRMINARAETLTEKNSFKRPFARQRCIIPADGFYEWTQVAGQKKKQPVFLRPADESIFAFAALWDVWLDPARVDGEGRPLELHSCTVITCPPNEAVATVHDRMPVLLPPSAWDEWLDRSNRDVGALQRLLEPAPASVIEMHPVSTAVNNVRNNGPHLLEEAGDCD